MMKKTKWLAVPLSMLLLAACGNNNDKEDVTNVPENAPTEHNGNTTGTNDNNGTNMNNNTVSNANAAFDFTHFSVDADYSMTESFEADYENEQSGVEASIEDDVKGERLYGDEAYARLEPILKGFTFDQSTPENEVIAEVLKGFGLAEDYQDIEIEVRFADGTEKEYHHRK